MWWEELQAPSGRESETSKQRSQQINRHSCDPLVKWCRPSSPGFVTHTLPSSFEPEKEIHPVLNAGRLFSQSTPEGVCFLGAFLVMTSFCKRGDSKAGIALSHSALSATLAFGCISCRSLDMPSY